MPVSPFLATLIWPESAPFRFFSFSRDRSAEVCPMATISASRVVRTVSSYCGLKTPFPSNTAVHRLNSMAESLPPFLKNCLGPRPLMIFTPSLRASSISKSHAGISSLFSRQTRVTAFAPERTAARAASTAAFPPPITTTLPIDLGFDPFHSRFKKEMQP